MEDKIRNLIKKEILKLTEGMSPEEWEAAKEKERLDQHPEKEKIMKIKQMMDKEKDEEQEEWDKGWYGESLKEAASKLGYLNEEENYQNLPTPDEISLSYTDPGFRFYGMYLYKDGKRFAKISYEDRATKYLKNLGVETEVPRRFDTDTLDKIKQEIEALGIKGDYDAAMDVS